MATMCMPRPGPGRSSWSRANGGVSRSNHNAFPPSPSRPTPPPSSPRRSPLRTSPRSPRERLKYKTEMCKFVRSPTGCRFGDSCLFAHSMEELKKENVVDLVRDGIIPSVDSYRTRPCMSFVSTGSCPFNNRCCYLHDPRVTGATKYWLPHQEQPIQRLVTDIFVEHLHHHIANTVSYGTPFAEMISKDVLNPKGVTAVSEQKHLKDWRQFYDDISSGKEAKKRSVAGARSASINHHPSSNLSERHRLEIVLKMRGGPDIDRHKYRPNNKMMQETCMVIQTRVFRIDSKSAIEVGFDAAAEVKNKSKTIVVREVAFGADANPSVKGVALWFNVPSSEVIPRTFEGRRAKKDTTAALEETAQVSAINDCLINAADPPFFLVRPRDEDAFNLTTSILNHRLQTLRAAEMKNKQMQRDINASLDAEDVVLRASFESLCRHWASSAWDANSARSRALRVGEETLSPDVDEKYQTKHSCASLWSFTGAQSESESQNMTSHVWESFVQDIGHEKTFSLRASSRLGTFAVLAQGMSVEPARSALPKMQKHGMTGMQEDATNPAWVRGSHEMLHLQRKGESEWDEVYKFFTTKTKRTRKLMRV